MAGNASIRIAPYHPSPRCHLHRYGVPDSIQSAAFVCIISHIRSASSLHPSARDTHMHPFRFDLDPICITLAAFFCILTTSICIQHAYASFMHSGCILVVALSNSASFQTRIAS
ncbi:hypothetical protein FRC03_000481 [Tulasnella sp. 419]|nr:hypothetical protein FRC03_000481 [Tulasnella sp. 419]